jgi:uncharacterized protein YukE
MGAININPEEISSIASACRTSGETISGEAAKMRSQVANLRTALQGIPRIAVAEDLENLDGLLSRVSEALRQSDVYLRDVVNKVDAFVASLGG